MASVPVHSQIVAAITGDNTLSGYVSARVYPILAPDGALMPYITYERSREPDNDSGGSTGTESLRLMVDVRAESYDTAVAIAEAIYDLLDGWKTPDPEGQEEPAIPIISSVHLTGETESTDGPTAGGNGFVYVVSQDYLIWYSR